MVLLLSPSISLPRPAAGTGVLAVPLRIGFLLRQQSVDSSQAWAAAIFLLDGLGDPLAAPAGPRPQRVNLAACPRAKAREHPLRLRRHVGCSWGAGARQTVAWSMCMRMCEGHWETTQKAHPKDATQATTDLQDGVNRLLRAK